MFATLYAFLMKLMYEGEMTEIDLTQKNRMQSNPIIPQQDPN